MSQAPQTTPAPNNDQASSASPAQNTSTISIPATAAVGGVTITQPPQTATSFFKVAQGQLITFGWNFTSLYITPTHLTVSAVCDNGNTYPVGPTDGVIDGTATQVVWDPWAWQQAGTNTPLAQASYTLHIWDDRGPNPPRIGGYMQPNTALKFALYTPQAYTPISSGWSCAACSGALSQYVAHPAFVGILTTFLVIFLSGFSLLRGTPRWR
ncbi:hypothetical protein PC9H_002343 [Pleurotus ostreatus]|uniref:DUF7137 domain-containing protein n=2 Tax=Pleurotus ostreatus TaxID=5322 RepID=A0A067NEP3_PLEO1|nr:uncharacterized protein PC9H_002343 [Pleurotus ostreatus]KAF7416083.1 hypothetical protein PC9H_002343 [Pleurotus ostreatus]KDQ22587.1 hypothetical protein PLEOSDRAFT_1095012 [Pleurotus ostreatus PC15]